MARFAVPFLAFRRKLPQEALAQFAGILESYDLLHPSGTAIARSDKEIDQLRDRLKTSPETLWWSDMAVAELCIVPLLPVEDVRARLMGWRRRLREVLGEGRYAAYMANAVDAVNEKDVELLRSDLSECIRDVYYFYGAYGLSARSRTQVTESLIKAAAIILGVETVALILILWVHFDGKNWSFSAPVEAWRVVAAGVIATSISAVLGSVVSVQRRLQDPSVSVDPLYRFIQTDADWFGTAVVSPLSASIFGMIMYGLLASQFLASSLVPLVKPGDAGAGIIGTPNGLGAYSALMILGFISGFAEQLIPDALTRIASRALSGVSATDPVAAGGSQAAGPATGTSNQQSTSATATGPSNSETLAAIGAQTLTAPAVLRATSAANALGQDPTLASEATAQDLRMGVA